MFPSTLPPSETVNDTGSIPRFVPVATTSTSEHYLEACARSNQKASFDDRLIRLFAAEKLPALPGEETLTTPQGYVRPTSKALQARLIQVTSAEISQLMYMSAMTRIQIKVPSGAFVAEAGNFAASTCWEPKFAPLPPSNYDVLGNTYIPLAIEDDYKEAGLKLSDIEAERPVYAGFLTRVEMAKRRHLYPLLWKALLANASLDITERCTSTAIATYPDKPKQLLYWNLCVMSRDPSVQPPVPGAVRAIIEPFVKRWVDADGMAAVWLEAGNARARDVYGYLGFRVVDEIVVGKDQHDEPVKIWCMIYIKQQPQTE